MASALVGLLSPACAASPVFRFGNAGDIVVCNCARPGKDKSIMVNEQASNCFVLLSINHASQSALVQFDLAL